MPTKKWFLVRLLRQAPRDIHTYVYFICIICVCNNILIFIVAYKGQDDIYTCIYIQVWCGCAAELLGCVEEEDMCGRSASA
jgi:hypothetical protein